MCVFNVFRFIDRAPFRWTEPECPAGIGVRLWRFDCGAAPLPSVRCRARRSLSRLRLPVLLAALAWAQAAVAAEFDDAGSCADGEDAAIWFSPRVPERGEPLKVMAVAPEGPVEDLSLVDASGRRTALMTTARGGPPWSLEARLDSVPDGSFQVEVRRRGQVVACREIVAGGVASRPVDGWDRSTEAFYSAWIETLFDAPPEESLSFPSLEPVLRNAERNFLHDFLGWNEDRRLPATPDCADLPYFLRAYFAWKVGLPAVFRACSRGSATAPPRCGAPVIEQGFVGRPATPAAFQGVIRRLVDTVHSGSARTGLADNQTDFYPVALERESLWPGTVYADPYGHVLVLVKWVPQTDGRSGLLLAVDAQPDNSVTRKRFWEGTFLYAGDIRSAGPGFKAYRPASRLADGSGPLRLLSNEALSDDPRFPPYSLEQASLETEMFYARMGKLMNPRGLDPEQAYRATLDALVEQLETRVESVDNGEAYFRRNPRALIAMPSGAAIFETVGPWEDYATPSRDMRLLIAMNVLAGLPERIVLYPELFLLGGRSPEVVREDLERSHRRAIAEKEITYTRSDGSPQRLSVAEIFGRQAAFEVGYNPNDCVEVRWGAESGSAEYASCRRHAPADQQVRMESYRPWFHQTRRPPRP